MAEINVSIEEGDPVYGSSAPGPGFEYHLDGSNFSTACYMEGRQTLTDRRFAEEIFFPAGYGGGQIHDRTRVGCTNKPADNIFLYNPLGYRDKTPSQIIQDLLVHQGNIGLFRASKFPTHDVSAVGWLKTGATYSGSLADNVSEDDYGDFVIMHVTGTLNQVVKVTAAGSELPSNCASVHEIVLRTWCRALEFGTGDGLGYEVTLKYGATPGVDTGTLIATKDIWVASGGGTPYHYTEIRFGKLNLTKAQADSIQVEIKNVRGFAGGGAASQWYMACLQLDCWYKPDDFATWDPARYTVVDSYYTTNYVVPASYLLDGDFQETSLGDAVLKVVAHAVELILAFDNNGELNLEIWPLYDDTPSPYTFGPGEGGLSPNFQGITRTFEYLGRWASERILKTGSDTEVTTWPGIAEPSNTFYKDKYIEDFNRYRDFDRDFGAEVLRELIRDDDVALYLSANQNQIYETPIPGIEIEVDKRILRVQCVDTVALNIPGLGYDDQKFFVAGMEIDLDEVTGSLILLDREFEKPYYIL